MTYQNEVFASPHFNVLDISNKYNYNISRMNTDICSERAVALKSHFPTGNRIFRGIPFKLGAQGDKSNNVLVLSNRQVSCKLPKTSHDRYIVFLHSADFKPQRSDDDGIFRPMKGTPMIGDTAAEYSLKYTDGTVHAFPIKRRISIGELYMKWGEYCFEAVPHCKPYSLTPATEDIVAGKTPMSGWGDTQRRVAEAYVSVPFWLYAYENPYPDKELCEISFSVGDNTVFILGISLCSMSVNPLVWETREKCILKMSEPDNLPSGDIFDRIQIDLGAVISVSPVLDYGNERWTEGYNNKQPVTLEREYIIEYTAHPDAIIYKLSRKPSNDNNLDFKIPLKEITEKYHIGVVNKEKVINKEKEKGNKATGTEIFLLPQASQKVRLKAVDKRSGRSVPVKLHIHGVAGEYLPPVNRHRIPNPYWFEDYSIDFVHGRHYCTYIDGTAELKLPLGCVYVEVSKGFEILPVRRIFEICENTVEIEIELEQVLPWREKGWVTADTHVHFLSPKTALLEGEAEGVNVVNLLASQWGELFTNVGDFDGKTTFGSRENGGSGEYLVRVGTENRQSILGHISLLGYEDSMILPLTTGGPHESAMGEVVEELLSGWAEKCKQQGGIAVLPHFPLPRGEGAAAIILGRIDGVEMTSLENHYSGIDPYSLSDWYRFLNCGYHVPAVGGTDKMSADTAVGTVRTYAFIKNGLFTYDSWMEAVRRGHTFVTYGPLLDFHVNGLSMGDKIEFPSSGATLDINWEVSSVTIPITKIELVVNSEIKEVKSVDAVLGSFRGTFSLKMEESGWIALRIRGRQKDKPEMIAAHSSAVMVRIDGKQCFNYPDAVTILEQIEGVTAYVRSFGPKAKEAVYKRLLMTLTSAHRAIHNRMHQEGVYHNHTVVDNHH